jgi:hypothetical protein
VIRKAKTAAGKRTMKANDDDEISGRERCGQLSDDPISLAF